MPMPSLFKYFAFVGASLLALITLANFLLDPSTGATAVATQTKTVVAVQHDPRASKIERWRNEQAALKAAAQTPTGANGSLVTKSEIAPPARQAAAAIEPAQAEPIQAQPALQTADDSADLPDAAEAARAAELAHIKSEKTKAAKARKAKIARERAKVDQLAREGGQSQQGQWGQWPQHGQGQQGQSQFFSSAQQRPSSNQQDQFYYGQRAPAQPRGPGYAYAPRPSFGPFDGFGRGW